MQLPFTSSVKMHAHTVVPFASSGPLHGCGERLGGRQRAAHEAPQTMTRRAISSPTTIHTMSDSVNAVHR